ncbi:NAD-dependent epimerase/dehydratase family protein [Chryseobacterium sp. G0186]|uniref:NAD-dependent epimerase/dehydratase family protein n=1 Tax=Chryseobacterium sp. G0186 TaxID=2487064 RepID=UPI000F514838|nr:NAD-dependent epimerase/dehydratase family protein [Chryseobacterium sp. G0186]AZA77665.1 NAD-dependent epimerase/dehydratase family protein [Chryseobacterium sp. G0186]
MKILFTGSNGFVGKNVIPILKEKGFEVSTLGSSNGDIVADLSNEIPQLSKNFDIVFHAAGKAHSIPGSPQEEKQFFKVNTQGTENLCKALEASPPKIFIFLSTVAVYGKDVGENIDENSPTLGTTPYAKSKLLAENHLINWAKQYNVKLFIFRPSLIAGPNPPGNLGDMMAAINKGRYFNIGKGDALKSLFWVDDFARLIELSPDKKAGIYNVCDSSPSSFKEIGDVLAKKQNKSILSIPFFVAKSLALFGDLLGSKAPINSLKLKKITKSLTFSNKQLMDEFGCTLTKSIDKL